MKEALIPFEKTNQFSPVFLDYIRQQNGLHDYYSDFPSLDTFSKSIDRRSEFRHRDLIASVLRKQNHHSDSDQVRENLGVLSDKNTFTVTTGHQLNLATGPLYFIFKILTVIRMCEELKKRYPENNFVPVYWMATEDHDLAEINHVHVFGKKMTWETTQTGAVGRMTTAGIPELLSELGPLPQAFLSAYADSSTLSEATRKLVASLLGKYGLLILDADDRDLKKQFVPVIKEEIAKGTTHLLVSSTNASLQSRGYEPLVHVRDINLFYLTSGDRKRLTRNGTTITTSDGKLSWTVEQLLQEVEEYPERFSPNVLLRPLYQEMILPNLAYCGGPSELIYWLQLKGLFMHFGVPFPLLLPRNFMMILPKSIYQKKKKLGLEFGDLFYDYTSLKREWLQKHGGLEFSAEEERIKLASIFSDISERIKNIDPTLVATAAAEEQKALKQLHELEKKVHKAIERSQEQQIKQLEGIISKIFPEGELQERHENILSFLVNDPDIIDKLHQYIRPLEFNFKIVYEE